VLGRTVLDTDVLVAAVRSARGASRVVAANQLINVAVAEKVSALRTEEYFAERAAKGKVKKALQLLRRAGIRPGRVVLPTGPGGRIVGLCGLDVLRNGFGGGKMNPLGRVARARLRVKAQGRLVTVLVEIGDNPVGYP
jgi:hypothetical protein